jgi:predicted DNA-binding ribbon-helix-helix protein
MKSLVVKRSVVVAGHKTSVSLEDPFWKSLKEIATSREVSLSDLLAAIDSGRHHGNLSSAIRVFVLNFYREQLLHRLDVRDKREAIQGLISGSARKSSKTPPSSWYTPRCFAILPGDLPSVGTRTIPKLLGRSFLPKWN